MSQEIATTPKLWGLATEKYFYFFMGLRKGEIRKQVSMMKSRYPDDTPRQLARRFVSSQAPLSLLGGAKEATTDDTPGLVSLSRHK